MLVFHNQRLRNFLQDSYSLEEIKRLYAFLEDNNTFSFPALENGLFPAALVSSNTDYTGYASVWVRDNIYLGYSHYIFGQTNIAVRNIKKLMGYFQKFSGRFTAIIEGNVSPDKIMERPHIRFDGRTLTEIDQEWEHAQNDALGYFLWFYCKLARDKLLVPEAQDLDTLALFPLYFQTIRYWQDEDSGHWEESRKIEASSIGVVIAGLKELKQLLVETNLTLYYQDKFVTLQFLDDLIERGTTTLANILPAECIQPEPQARRYDAALLFLIYPLQVLEGEIAEQILRDVIDKLQGDYGIRRYLGDSFWCRNYKDIPPEIRTTIATEREQWLQEQGRELIIGEEAQWCIFDPIVSAIFGVKFQNTGKQEYLELQTQYFNRSLGQITDRDFELGEFKCPELYYLENGQYVPNDATPLLWTQANLRVAFQMMETSLCQVD